MNEQAPPGASGVNVRPLIAIGTIVVVLLTAGYLFYAVLLPSSEPLFVTFISQLPDDELVTLEVTTPEGAEVWTGTWTLRAGETDRTPEVARAPGNYEFLIRVNRTREVHWGEGWCAPVVTVTPAAIDLAQCVE